MRKKEMAQGYMEERAIPQGYMTVGEVAKKMGITVRTLQHYDREGLLSPSAVSGGGRRLYTDRDLVQLHQILSLKHLGFSLGDIKNRLIPLDSPKEVAEALLKQEEAIREQIKLLSEALSEVKTLREEALQMKTVDFKKYADIIVNLQMKNEYYWMIKYFDEKTLDHIRSRFDRDSGLAFIQKFFGMQEEAIRMYEEGVPADGSEGIRFAERYWEMLMEFTGGDMSLLSGLMEFAESGEMSAEWKEKQELAGRFTEPALEAYFKQAGCDPFSGKGAGA